jgi:DNA-directed RNA polymerase subunit RPC12/RpoP
MNGSVDPERRTDQQCEHCGLWFARRGIHKHEETCPLRDKPVMCQPLASEVADEEASTEDEIDVEADTSESADDVEPSTGSFDPDDSEPAEPAVTDGGSAAAPPTFDTLERGEEDDTGPETLDCPHCGADTGEPEMNLTPGKRYRCTDCGKSVRYNP